MGNYVISSALLLLFSIAGEKVRLPFTFISGTGGGGIVNTTNVALLAPSSLFMALLLTEDVVDSVTGCLPYCCTNASYFVVLLLVVSKPISLVFIIICLDRVRSSNVVPISKDDRCYLSKLSYVLPVNLAYSIQFKAQN